MGRTSINRIIGESLPRSHKACKGAHLSRTGKDVPGRRSSKNTALQTNHSGCFSQNVSGKVSQRGFSGCCREPGER